MKKKSDVLILATLKVKKALSGYVTGQNLIQVKKFLT